jgi:hypothetical protein
MLDRDLRRDRVDVEGCQVMKKTKTLAVPVRVWAFEWSFFDGFGEELEHGSADSIGMWFGDEEIEILEDGVTTRYRKPRTRSRYEYCSLILRLCFWRSSFHLNLIKSVSNFRRLPGWRWGDCAFNLPTFAAEC